MDRDRKRDRDRDGDRSKYRWRKIDMSKSMTSFLMVEMLAESCPMFDVVCESLSMTVFFWNVERASMFAYNELNDACT